MNNLELIKLEEICTITKLAGTEFSDIVEYIPEGEIIALRALNIKNGKLELQNIKRISKSISERLVRSKLMKDDIVMTATGTVGEVAIIEEDNKYHLGPNLAVIRPKNIDPTYLFACMRGRTPGRAEAGAGWQRCRTGRE